MSQWYYSTDGRQRQGPLPAAVLREMIASFRLPAATVFWREGMDGWKRLEDLADVAGLQARPPAVPAPSHLPPPVPPAPGAGKRATPAEASAGARPRYWLIAPAVALACLLPAAGILAAIALPAYQSYTQRAASSDVLRTLEPLTEAIDLHQRSRGQCPHNTDLAASVQHAQATSAHIARIDLQAAVNGHCGMAVQLQGLHRRGSHNVAMLWLEHDRDNAAWLCRSTLEDRQLPPRCRR